MLITTLLVAFGVLLVTVDGPHGKVRHFFYWTTSYIHILTVQDCVILLLQHVEELLEYVRYSLWWIALGVASSIGLG